MTLQIKTRAQFYALVHALDQYTCNEGEHLEFAGEPETDELRAAQAYLDALQSVLCSLAEPCRLAAC